MESLFRQCDLEVRVSLNLNVLDAEQIPRVMSLREALLAFLEHRHVVLVRRSSFRLGKIEHRLEVLAGYLIAYLNIDEVIRIIREEDEPKAEMMQRWDLSDVQAEAILNMRLRALRRLEEIEIRKEHEELVAEKLDIEDLLSDESRRWHVVASEISTLRKDFGKTTKLGKRRTDIAGPPLEVVVPMEAMVEREPITVVCSEKGWIRAIKGHLGDDAELKFKDGDGPRFLLRAETTDRILVFATDGRFYTLQADKLPRGRSHGEPLRLMIELANDHDLVTLELHRPDRQFLIASDDGRGFRVNSADVIAQTRSGRQVMNPALDAKATICIAADGDSVAIVGTNRKLLIFPLEEVPELTRGKGVILQRYTDGKMADAKVFRAADGISWHMNGGRQRTETDLTTWIGKRASAGKMPPTGFPRPPRFN